MDLSALARYLVFPLQSAAVILVAVFSFLLVLATAAGLIGIPLGAIALLWFAKYAFVLLDAAMEGAKQPPVLSAEMVNPANEQRPMVLLSMSIAIYYGAAQSSYWF